MNEQGRKRHKHPRLRGYDYSQVGAYFVTICTHDRIHLFGRVVDPVTLAVDPFMELNELGSIVQQCWEGIPARYPMVELDAFQIMPDHVHCIIVITDAPTTHVASTHASTNQNLNNDRDRSRHASTDHDPNNDQDRSRHAATQRRSLGTIVGSFKSAVAKGVNDLRGTPGAPVWQKGYHDRIIRDEAEHDRIAQYIAQNPAAWSADPDNA